MVLRWGALTVGLVLELSGTAIAVESCPQPSTPIASDRPSFTNSSTVVPSGSLQSENGANVTGRDGDTVFDATNSRLRFGITPCLELLVDMPDYFAGFRGVVPSGFGDLSPAIKWQISPIPGKIDLSMTFGTALPTGAVRVTGSGSQPYLQFPWSADLGNGWSLGGMMSNLFTPDNPMNAYTDETTFMVQKTIGKNASAFLEYVGEYPLRGGNTQLLHSGATYRLTDTQQIDFHLGFGPQPNLAGLPVRHRLFVPDRSPVSITVLPYPPGSRFSDKRCVELPNGAGDRPNGVPG